MSQVQATSVLLVRLLSTSSLKLSVKSKVRSYTDNYNDVCSLNIYMGKHKPPADDVLIFDEVQGSLPVDMEL